MPKLDTVYVFPDANYFLHWPAPDQIDWCKLTDSISVIIVISLSAIHELNEKKDDPRAPRLTRERAKKSLRFLKPLIREESLEISEHVQVVPIRHEPTQVDFDAVTLAKDRHDDRLQASIIQFRNENPGAKIMLATDDAGLQLKAPSNQIEILDLPQEKRLPDEADEVEKENRRLQEENRAFKNARPILALTFANGFEIISNPDCLQLPDEVIEYEQEYWSLLNEEAERKKVRREQQERLRMTGLPDMNSLMAPGSAFLLHHEVGAADAQFEERMVEFKKYLASTLQLELKVSNSGTAPAKNVVVHLNFEGPSLLRLSSGLLQVPTFSLERLRTRSTRTGNVRIDGFNAEWRTKSVKHEIPIAFGPVFVTLAFAKAFRIKYAVHADNQPSPVRSLLKVEFAQP
jgi:hypothetical protein